TAGSSSTVRSTGLRDWAAAPGSGLVIAVKYALVRRRVQGRESRLDYHRLWSPVWTKVFLLESRSVVAARWVDGRPRITASWNNLIPASCNGVVKHLRRYRYH